jgi:hypothetical protein
VFTLPVRVKPKVRIALPTLPPAPDAKGSGNMIFQNDRTMLGSADPSTPPETRRASVVDESKTSTPPAGSTSTPASDPEHPANMLMNLLLKSASKPVDSSSPPASR